MAVDEQLFAFSIDPKHRATSPRVNKTLKSSMKILIKIQIVVYQRSTRRKKMRFWCIMQHIWVDRFNLFSIITLVHLRRASKDDVTVVCRVCVQNWNIRYYYYKKCNRLHEQLKILYRQREYDSTVLWVGGSIVQRIVFIFR